MKVVLATSIWMRLTGLLHKKRCIQGEVLMLAPCKSVHTIGMRTPIDVVFLDAKARVLAAELNVLPNKVLSHKKAVAVLERRSATNPSWPSKGEVLSISISKCDSLEEESGCL
ncbi:MAG: DUF192 domain-containing protein [Coriobacteriia bacterium]|nr:DUF192 domain-containing protein [Coriobacteriia bacterium]